MNVRMILIRGWTAAVLAATLAACGAAPTPAPTIPPTTDPAVIHTQAAATIYARQTAEVTPTFTPSPLPTATFTPAPTATPAEPSPTPGPTATKQIVGDAARFTGTAPVSGVQIEPNQMYNLEFDFLNVGTTTWNANYKLVWVGGEQFTSVTIIPLNMEVPPGKKGVFVLGTFGSEDMNTHYTRWQLYNDRGVPVAGGIGDFWYQPV